MKTLKVHDFLTANEHVCKFSSIGPPLSFQREISTRGINRPGLALTGFLDLFDKGKIQLCGSSEVAFIKKATSSQLEKIVGKMKIMSVPCFIFSDNNPIPQKFVKIANRFKIPIIKSALSTEQVSRFINRYLDDFFAPRIVVHGAFVDVYGVGLLLTGKSGIGKSEIALDLVERGHRLIADDAVSISRQPDELLIGSGNELLRYFIELRGIGIIDIKSIFGLKAVRQEKRFELEIKLERWNKRKNYERVGLDTRETSYLDVRVPIINLPIFPGKNIAVILEVISLNYILSKNYGISPIKQINERMIQLMKEKSLSAQN